MHDFCFTIPYGLLLVFGGVMGYATKGSIASLAGGVGTGLVLVLAGYISMAAHNKRKTSFLASILQTVFGGVMGYATKGSIASLGGGVGTGLVLVLAAYISLSAFNKRKTSFFASFLQTACALMLTYVMGQRYARTSKIMPAGLVAGISVVMTVFYLYKIVTGGNKIPPKTE